MRETIIVNGQERAWSTGLTVGALLASLSLNPDRVAVELNGDILAENIAEHRIYAGDEIEIVQFVGGG